jgi:hypothetical protein
MEPSKQIRAVAQTYLREQQLKEQAEYISVREQAEYISVLEHTIEVIAEHFGFESQQLINELNVMGALKTGGISGAIKAFKANVKNRGLLGSLPLGKKSTKRAIDSTRERIETSAEERAKEHFRNSDHAWMDAQQIRNSHFPIEDPDSPQGKTIPHKERLSQFQNSEYPNLMRKEKEEDDKGGRSLERGKGFDSKLERLNADRAKRRRMDAENEEWFRNRRAEERALMRQRRRDETRSAGDFLGM